MFLAIICYPLVPDTIRKTEPLLHREFLDDNLCKSNNKAIFDREIYTVKFPGEELLNLEEYEFPILFQCI